MSFYATRDSDGLSIARNAAIYKFATRESAERWLKAGAEDSDFSTSVEYGSFGDCWIKSLKAPQPAAPWIAPFDISELSVSSPGQHPGGPFFWTTPRCEVLVLNFTAND